MSDEHIHPSLRHLAIPVDELTPDPVNARARTDKNVAAIKASLLKFGFRQPIVAQRKGEELIVRVGNGRLQVCKSLGWPTIPCLIVEEGDGDAAAYALADNRSAELAEWDAVNLSAVLEGIEGLSPTADLGWESYELNSLTTGDLDNLFPEDNLHVLAAGDSELAKARISKSKDASLTLKFSSADVAYLRSLFGGKPTSRAIMAFIKAI